jgi:hypothetical protein
MAKICIRFAILSLLCAVVACGQGVADSNADGTEAAPRSVASEVKREAAPSFDANGQPPPDYLATPYGYRHKSCVHVVAQDAVVDENSDVTSANGEVTHYGPCPYPEIDRAAIPPTIGHTWIESSFQSTPGQGFNEVFTLMFAPPYPTNEGSQILYFFPALQDSNGQTSIPLMQPVLGWGTNGINCSESLFEHYCLASWYLISGNTFIGNTVDASPGDEIIMEMYVVASGQQWYVQTYDVSTLQDATLYANSSTWFELASPAVFEVWNVSSCNQLPGSSVTFSDISLYIPDPGWTSYGAVSNSLTASNNAGGLSPSCGYGVSINNSEGTTTLYY